MSELKPVHVRFRQKVCERCPSPCEALLSARIRFSDESATCPLNRWPKVRLRTVGLGDVVAAVAQPIARGIDAVAGTKLAGCGSCAKRKERLNAAMPDITRPLQ